MKNVKCAFCGLGTLKNTGHYNRSFKIGAPMYCDKVCAGRAKRVERNITEKKQLKKIYDEKYRALNRQKLLKRKNDYYRANREKILAGDKVKRPLKRQYMREYLKGYWTPDKKKEKKDYDRKFRARKKFGPLWEAHYLTVLIDEEVKRQMTKHDIRIIKGNYNKKQRRDKYGKTKCSLNENSTMGNS